MTSLARSGIDSSSAGMRRASTTTSGWARARARSASIDGSALGVPAISRRRRRVSGGAAVTDSNASSSSSRPLYGRRWPTSPNTMSSASETVGAAGHPRPTRRPGRRRDRPGGGGGGPSRPGSRTGARRPRPSPRTGHGRRRREPRRLVAAPRPRPGTACRAGGRCATVQTIRPPAARNTSSASRKAFDALSAVVFGRSATQHARQPVQVQDDADVVGPQRDQRRQRDRIVEVGQAVHPDRHEPGLLESAGEQGLERVLGIERPGRHDHRSVVAGGADARDALGGIGEVAALRPRPTRPTRTAGLGLVAGGSAQHSADRLAKVRHTGEG